MYKNYTYTQDRFIAAPFLLGALVGGGTVALLSPKPYNYQPYPVYYSPYPYY